LIVDVDGDIKVRDGSIKYLCVIQLHLREIIRAAEKYWKNQRVYWIQIGTHYLRIIRGAIIVTDGTCDLKYFRKYLVYYLLDIYRRYITTIQYSQRTYMSLLIFTNTCT